MNDTEKYILDSIKRWVWSGFYGPEEVQLMIDDLLEGNADETMLRAAVEPEFGRKAREEASWPGTTDCDRLDRAFEALRAGGLIALHNAGNTMSEGFSDVEKALERSDRSKVRGYCFYHGQDVERAVSGGGLYLAYGDLRNTPAGKTEIARLVKQALEDAGLQVRWEGDPETRIFMPDIDWKRRYANG